MSTSAAIRPSGTVHSGQIRTAENSGDPFLVTESGDGHDAALRERAADARAELACLAGEPRC